MTLCLLILASVPPVHLVPVHSTGQLRFITITVFPSRSFHGVGSTLITLQIMKIMRRHSVRPSENEPPKVSRFLKVHIAVAGVIFEVDDLEACPIAIRDWNEAKDRPHAALRGNQFLKGLQQVGWLPSTVDTFPSLSQSLYASLFASLSASSIHS